MLIAEFVEATGLTRDAVRFYIKRGLLKPQVLTSNRYQQFDASDVERVLLIQTAQSLGFTIAQIVSFQLEFESGRLDKERQIEVLAGQLTALDVQAAKLRGMRSYLKKKIAWMQGGEVGPPPQLLRAPGSKPLLESQETACLHVPEIRKQALTRRASGSSAEARGRPAASPG